MSSQAYHDVTCSRARHPIVLQGIHEWLNENHFNCLDTGSSLILLARKGAYWGLSAETRIREIEILVRPEFGLTLVSIYHRTTHFSCVDGLMGTDILEQESDSLINVINALPE